MRGGMQVQISHLGTPPHSLYHINRSGRQLPRLESPARFIGPATNNPGNPLICPAQPASTSKNRSVRCPEPYGSRNVQEYDLPLSTSDYLALVLKRGTRVASDLPCDSCLPPLSLLAATTSRLMRTQRARKFQRSTQLERTTSSQSILWMNGMHTRKYFTFSMPAQPFNCRGFA
jgi:hypothetical protein